MKLRVTGSRAIGSALFIALRENEIMNVIALIRSLVETNREGKPGALLTLETENPLQITEVRLNKSHVEMGVIQALKPFVGKVAQVPLAVESFNGRTELKWPFGVPFSPPVSQAK